MRWTRRKVVIVVAAVVIVASLVSGALLALGGGGQPQRASAAPSESAQQMRSPFTGEPVRSLNPVLAIKIDNIVYARPQTGLTRADIVYVLPVEGGLSRFLAIFSSGYPPVAGPVRSAREDDLQLLAQFGRPAFAYSGATPALLRYIHRTARIVDLYAGTARGYYRDNRRVAPYNLYAHTPQLLAQAPGASRARDIGFRFGPPPPGGKITQSASVSYPAASFTFTWSDEPDGDRPLRGLAAAVRAAVHHPAEFPGQSPDRHRSEPTYRSERQRAVIVSQLFRTSPTHSAVPIAITLDCGW
jgi:hypothetical protein